MRLGLTNTLRQLGRNTLVVLAMVLSAVSLTSALSYSTSSTKDAYRVYRLLLGGEILVSPVPWTGQSKGDLSGEAMLHSARLHRTGLSWLEQYYPELYSKSFLSNTAENTQFLSADTVQRLATETDISGYSLHYQFPASLTNGTTRSEIYSQVTVLPLPDSNLLPEGLGAQLATERQPYALINAYPWVDDDMQRRVAASILDSEVSSIYDEVRLTPDQILERKLKRARPKIIESMDLPSGREAARLRIPVLQSTSNGQYLPDYSQTFEVDIPSSMQVAIPTRQTFYSNEQGFSVADTANLHGDYVWLPEPLWRQLWDQASQSAPLPICNLALKVSNMDDLEKTVERLRITYPQLTFVSVAEFAFRAESSDIIDRFYNLPHYLYQPSEPVLAVPMKLGKLMGLLFFLIAGMLIASRMLTGAAARRLEIGILKALGARRRDILAMVLSESLTVTVFGTTLGFLLARAGGAFVELGNRVPSAIVLARTVQQYGIVVGTATAVSLLFCLLPAMRMSNLTVMGVLRGE